MSHDQHEVRAILDDLKQQGGSALDPADAQRVAAAYGITTPGQGIATSSADAADVAADIGLPVVLKIVSPDLLHKTDAGGVLTDVATVEEVVAGFDALMTRAQEHVDPDRIAGVLVQQQVGDSLEVIVGAVSDPVFGKLVAFGLGGTLVEIVRDITFRLAPTDATQARAMLDDINASAVLDGVRGAPPANRAELATLIQNVSQLVTDFPEISELDLNPVLVGADTATAVDVRILVDFEAVERPASLTREQILPSMQRIMQPQGVAVIGASAEDGKIGNSVMKNLIDGGYTGGLYPIHPKATEIMGLPCYASVTDVPDNIDIAIFCIPAKFVAGVLAEVGRKEIPGAILIPSGFAEVGEHELQAEVVRAAQDNNVRLMGPNIYGFYYTHSNLCATFCTPYGERGKVALSSQSGGVGMAIVGFSRSAKMGVSAIVGLGNKADIDEDDLLTFFEEDPNTNVIAMHVEDLKDGRAFAEAAKRVTPKKPVVMTRFTMLC
jgi:acyl-CoA synthetase (NDP forming)